MTSAQRITEFYMFDPNMLTALKQTVPENPTLFPFPFGLHTGFAIFAFIFFLFRFFTDKKPFQLIFAVAIPFSMTLWLSESRTWFYTVGAIELAFILCAFLSSFASKKKTSEPEQAADDKASENSPEDKSDNKSKEADASENDGE